MAEPGPDPRLGERFVRALALAVELHAGHARKRTRVPYVSHLLAVAGLVLEHGGDEDTSCAALLHDAPEDRGGEPVLERIRAEMGERVARIVRECSEPLTRPMPSWEERKQDFLSRLPGASPEARRVVAADKLHNLTTLVADLRELGPAVWARFNRGPVETLAYHRRALAILRAGGEDALVRRLALAVAELEREVGGTTPPP
jgi:(p)ppGpp synthase/HD superfamily hydrolase